MEDIIKKLEQGIIGIKEKDDYKKFLKKVSLFRKYSFNNTLLIAMQKPDATLVASFTSWKKLKRTVNKGEKGIKIIIPFIRSNKETEEKKVVGYSIGHVFDISQTSGEELRSIYKSDKQNIKFQDIADKISILTNCPIQKEELDDEIEGMFKKEENKIIINSNLPNENSIIALLHETAHNLLHKKNKYETNVQEVQAESIAYVVGEYLGIDLKDNCFKYIDGYLGIKGIDEFRDNIELIKDTSEKIIKHLNM